MSWATPQDVIDRWVGSGAPEANDPLTTALIADAEAVILSEFPLIQDRITANTLAESVVVMVVCRMVMRVLRNPEGLTYTQQQTGPFGQAKNYGSADRTDIWLSSEEEEMLAPKRRGKAYEVDLAPNAYPGIPIAPYVSENTFGDFYRLLGEED